MKYVRLIPVLAALVLLGACAPTPDAPTARVFFVAPEDGAVVDTTFTVTMGVEGMRLAPAGTFEEGTGHLHLIMDAPFVPAGTIVPADAKHIHYGDASSEDVITLAPGEHVLRIQLADGAHAALADLQAEISVTVR